MYDRMIFQHSQIIHQAKNIEGIKMQINSTNFLRISSDQWNSNKISNSTDRAKLFPLVSCEREGQSLVFIIRQLNSCLSIRSIQKLPQFEQQSERKTSFVGHKNKSIAEV